MELAIKSKAPCLLRLSRQEGCDRHKIETLLKMHLVALDAFLKQKNGLSREEIELVAEEVMDKYGNVLTFADINVIMRNAKLGRYGELYNQLSCAKIIKWFDDYVSERLEMGYQLSLEEDRARYGLTSGRSGEEVLTSLGYSIGKDGNIVLDKDKIEAQRIAREQEKQRQEQKKREQIEKDNEYFKFKTEVAIKTILAKKEEERSEGEVAMLNQYMNQKTQNNG